MMRPRRFSIASPEYRRFIEHLKDRVASARLSAARAVNRDLILLYWDIGRGIVDRQLVLGWGESVVESVATDLRRAFPATTGFSARNLRSAKQLYLAYSDPAIWLQTVAKLPRTDKSGVADIWPQAAATLTDETVIEPLRQLVSAVPWGHNLIILNRLSDPVARLYYLRATTRFGWSRNVLMNQIKAGSYERAVIEKKSHNFPLALPEHLAEQAEEVMKSSYSLEFLGLQRAVRERELEDRLISRLQAFLLELGYGFCFVGRQHRLTLGQKECPAHEDEPHRRGRISTPVEIADGSQGQTADAETACRSRASGAAQAEGEERLDGAIAGRSGRWRTARSTATPARSGWRSSAAAPAATPRPSSPRSSACRSR